MRSTEGYVLAEALAARVLGEDAVVTDRFTGADMVGAGYEPPFPFIPASEYGEKGHTVLPGGLRLAPRTAPASSTPRSRSARTTSASAPSTA